MVLMVNTSTISLQKHLSQQLAAQSNAETLPRLLHAIAEATIEIATMIAKGTTTEVNTKLTSKNVQGETQMQLDVLSNTIFVERLKETKLVAGLVSEELDNALDLNVESNDAPFLVSYDPLDGSSNIAVNGCIGSIFSVVNAPRNDAVKDADYLQKGNRQVAAGYTLYGPSSMLVLTIGRGTHGYTLDRDAGEYRLTHPDIKVPEMTSEFSINASNERFWEQPVQRYIAECKAGSGGVRSRDFNMRWVASMVADVHRILMRGGVYLYPKDNKLPLKAGRLRLLYEANPMGFIVEQAGGRASTGRQQLLDVAPTEIHQRISVVLGSSVEVSLIELYYKEFDESHFYNEVI